VGYDPGRRRCPVSVLPCHGAEDRGPTSSTSRAPPEPVTPTAELLSRCVDERGERGSDAPRIPQCVGATAERIISARGRPVRLKRVLGRSLVPILVVDNSRRYLEANVPARLAFRLSLSELRRLRIDDLTPCENFPVMERAWDRLMTTGCVAGPYEVRSPDGSRFGITYYGLANALPGQHVIIFAPEWTDDGEFLRALQEIDTAPTIPLTRRELQVLELSAEGHTGPAIARELVVSIGTIRTHFENIYAKLGVSDRAAAVAKAMRLGLVS
jgi:DNA-binding CsgD family transcriptional regulator/PAS domain-containing protein